MTNQRIKKRLMELEEEIVELEKEIDQLNQVEPHLMRNIFKLRTELTTGSLLLEYRENHVQRAIDALFCSSVSTTLVSLGYSLGQTVVLMALNFCLLFVLLRYARQLTQVIHRRSFIFWFVSDMGGNLPEWYQYRSKIRRELVGIGVLFGVWTAFYLQIKHVSDFLTFMGLALMAVTVLLETKQSKLDLMRDVYPLAKNIVELNETYEALSEKAS